MLILKTFKYVIPPTYLISLHCTLTSGTKAPSAIRLRDASLGIRFDSGDAKGKRVSVYMCAG